MKELMKKIRALVLLELPMTEQERAMWILFGDDYKE